VVEHFTIGDASESLVADSPEGHLQLEAMYGNFSLYGSGPAAASSSDNSSDPKFGRASAGSAALEAAAAVATAAVATAAELEAEALAGSPSHALVVPPEAGGEGGQDGGGARAAAEGGHDEAVAPRLEAAKEVPATRALEPEAAAAALPGGPGSPGSAAVVAGSGDDGAAAGRTKTPRPSTAELDRPVGGASQQGAEVKLQPGGLQGSNAEEVVEDL